jgi:SAM-dependent methyltransferase
MAKIFRAFRKLGYALLYADFIRRPFCRIRWIFLRRNLQFQDKEAVSGAVGGDTINHNFTALSRGDSAAFGMAKRMSLLLYPTAAILKDRLETARVLIVGPRTEDDIFWAKSLGLWNTEGFDLFSYSKHIKVGDIHASGLPSGSYDAVLLGWMISYSTDPAAVVAECRRILKPGGLLGIGIESNPLQRTEGIQPPRVNSLNSTADLVELVKAPVAFSNEPFEDVLYDCAVVFKFPPGPVFSDT